MYSLAFSILFVSFIILTLIVRFWLASRQIRHVAAHRGTVPAAFAGSVTLAAHQKAADYTIARGRLGTLHLAWDTALLIGWTLLGGLDLLNQWALTWRHELGGMGYQLALLTAFALLSGVLDLPWSLYSTFRLEERFGFNRTTLRLFIVDGLKGGETILFHAAAGGVGLIACQWAKLLGLNLIGTAGSDEKCELARQHGAGLCREVELIQPQGLQPRGRRHRRQWRC